MINKKRKNIHFKMEQVPVTEQLKETAQLAMEITNVFHQEFVTYVV